MAGSPAIVDWDNDGFIGTAYGGNLAGNPWKFNFCPFDPDTTKLKQCNTNNWSAIQLLDPQCPHLYHPGSGQRYRELLDLLRNRGRNGSESGSRKVSESIILPEGSKPC